jgi:hypothetical protein
LARELGVDAEKIHALIRSGELRAVNLAVNANGQRPRYRILRSEVERFLQARSTRPPEQTRRRRRALAAAGKEYF